MVSLGQWKQGGINGSQLSVHGGNSRARDGGLAVGHVYRTGNGFVRVTHDPVTGARSADAPMFEDSSAALSAGLSVGDVYQTSDGRIRVVVNAVTFEGGSLPVYGDNSAARDGGLAVGTQYRTHDGHVKVVKTPN